MKRKKTGFTIVELLTVIGVIAILLGVLLPAVTMVRNFAKTTKQKAQFAMIEMAILAYKNDQGDYPPSMLDASIANNYYLGAQMLSEALVGWDLMGFHPGDNNYQANGHIDNGGEYDSDDNINLDQRKGPYLELAKANVFKLRDLYPNDIDNFNLAPDTYVLCDSFGVYKVRVGNKTVKAGSPILYYKADTTKKSIEGPMPGWIYDVEDNLELLEVDRVAKKLKDPHPLGAERYSGYPGKYSYFSNYIKDPKVFEATGGRMWPYNADSYILISAGADGRYGTGDDITNFGN